MGNAKGSINNNLPPEVCISVLDLVSHLHDPPQLWQRDGISTPKSRGLRWHVSRPSVRGGSGTRGALKWEAAGCREAVSSRARAKQVKDETRPKRLRDLVLGVPLEYPLNDEYKEDEV